MNINQATIDQLAVDAGHIINANNGADPALEDFACRVTTLCTALRSVLEMIPGPTGQFPQGKTRPDDEGEIRVAIATDKKNGVLRFHFGKPVAWLALPKKDVEGLIAVMQQKASELA